MQYYACTVAFILLFSEAISLYSYYMKEGLVYVAIVAPSSRQPFSCAEYTRLNVYISCDVYSMSDAEYIYTRSMSL